MDNDAFQPTVGDAVLNPEPPIYHHEKLVKRVWPDIRVSASTHNDLTMLQVLFSGHVEQRVMAAYPGGWQIERLTPEDWRIFPGGSFQFAVPKDGGAARLCQSFRSGLEKFGRTEAVAIEAINGEIYVHLTKGSLIGSNADDAALERLVRRLMRGKWVNLAGEPPRAERPQAPPASPAQPLTVQERMGAVITEINDLCEAEVPNPHRLRILADGTYVWQAPTIK